ncbi:MAG: FtsX-like permease family protein [Cyclobacteriaceae bacterium]|nr:FtsX-like permease family protein [Cyclobacteriaceae bacterium]
MKGKKDPPQLLLKFFRWFCHPKLRSSIEGDLTELYNERLEEIGKRKADWKFSIDVLLLFRPGIIRPSEGYQQINQYGMFKNYFKVGIRNILKYKVFSFINIFGLAVAMSVCMLIILMLADQKSYDQFHEKKDRIYRVLTKIKTSLKPNASSPFPLAQAIRSEYPITESATQLTPGPGGDVMYKEKSVEMRGFFADQDFFNVFSFPLKAGNKKNALASPHSMIITSNMADRLFKNEDPIGKTVDFTNRGLNHLMGDGESSASPWGSFTITGVVDDGAFKSHIKFDLLISASTMPALYTEEKILNRTDDWQQYSYTYTYVLLNSKSNDNDLKDALNDLAQRKYKDFEKLKGLTLIAQSLPDITPGIFVGNPISFSLPIEVYYLLSVLALAIMISAGVNYTNLSTARALTRAKEIGVRKITGARRRDLVYQFLSESVMISFLALMLAMVLMNFIKPAFKGFWVNQFLHFELDQNLYVYLAFAVFALLVGIFAGTYPAFLLSKYQPLQVIRKRENEKPNKWGTQKFLSTSQFVISLFFITTSILLYNQFRHHLAIDYGLDSKHVVNIKLQGNDYDKVANELVKTPGVINVSASDYLPATGTQNGASLKIAGSEKDFIQHTVLQANNLFTENLDIRIIAGKNLPSSQNSKYILVNRSAARRLGFENPSDIIGQLIERSGSSENLEVIGVMENFRFRMPSEQEEIAPLMISDKPSAYRYANIRFVATDRAEFVSRLDEAWKQIDTSHPLSYKFYDDQLAENNQGFVDIVSIIGFIAFLAITIACLGMLGMATYSVERRTKEIGVRKVLGAGDNTIALLLSKSFLRVLTVSVFIGAPLSYFVNNLWLQRFPNRVDFGWGTILTGAFILLSLGLITIGSQAFRASRNNPVDSLRME